MPTQRHPQGHRNSHCRARDGRPLMTGHRCPQQRRRRHCACAQETATNAKRHRNATGTLLIVRATNGHQRWGTLVRDAAAAVTRKGRRSMSRYCHLHCRRDSRCCLCEGRPLIPRRHRPPHRHCRHGRARGTVINAEAPSSTPPPRLLLLCTRGTAVNA